MDVSSVMFEGMQVRSMVSWTSVLSGLVRFKEALETFHHLQFCKVRADESTMVSVVTACPGEWARIYMSRSIGGCAGRVHSNSEIGELAAEHLLKLNPDNSTTYILLSNIYAKSNKWKDVRLIRSHPISKEIYLKLEKVLTDLRSAGCVPDITEVFVEVVADEKQKVLYYHS
ncbi:hypothetical protein GUJ93_ZPchr0001g32394 [Zizania palustris]|uniref:Pentatricopeptide repeat-containing protein n=1 Tax=Zizania palustris TaxID=103762 RepID=A0A8J5R7M8_ZIZPA|nr:hypothetical protein GUJ93_ZPchr0001g32394 [Zizania palustris]